MTKHAPRLLALLFTGWSSTALATADGPDYFAVSGVAEGHVLNLREGPAATTRRTGVIPHDGWGLRNLGCEGMPTFAEWEAMSEGERVESGRHRWCRIEYRGVTGWVAGRYLREDAGPYRQAGTPTAEQLANATYWGIEERPVRLVDGTWEGPPFVAGAASRPRVRLLEPRLRTDANGDGVDDAWVLLTRDSGGSGEYLYVAAVTARGGRTDNRGTLRVGDRVDIMAFEISDGNARLDYVTQAPGEPACCPTLMVSSVYGLEGYRVVERSRTELGRLSVKTLEGTEWRLLSVDREDVPAGESPITVRFEGDRVTGSAGCNNYFAAVEAPTPYELSIGPVGSTRKACPPPVMDAETRYLATLEGANGFSFVLGRLVIFGRAEGRPSTLTFEAGSGK